MISFQGLPFSMESHVALGMLEHARYRTGEKRDAAPLLHSIGLYVAGTLTLRTLARPRAVGALTAITGPLAHGALA